MRCPDENRLAGYVDNVLGVSERAALAQHIDSCQSCRAMVSDLARIQEAVPHNADDPTEVAPALGSNRGLDTTFEMRVGDRAPLRLSAGATVGEYEVVGPLGVGGMGAVFAAIHPRIGKKVAIKVLNRELAQDPSALVRFENEARAVNAIGHPNLVDIFAFGELPDGSPYFIMEHVEGEGLDRWLKPRGAVQLAEAMPILREIFDAVAAAHDKGIVHRDLKPENIMVAGSASAPRVKVLDFGLAKIYRRPEDPELTNPGTAMGTPYFMSPEQCLGHDVDHRTDVYALGVLVYQILCGCYPFAGNVAAEIVRHQLLTEPRAPSSISGELPASIDPIILKALAKDLTVRYSSIRQFQAALETCLAEHTATEPRQRRKWILAGSVVAIAATGGLLLVHAVGPDSTPSSSGGPSTEVARLDERSIATHPVANTAAAPTEVVTAASTPVPAGSGSANVVSAPVAPVKGAGHSKTTDKTGKLALVVPGRGSAKIVIDGNHVTIGRDHLISLSPGLHDVIVSAPDMASKKLRVEIVAGRTTKQTVKLEHIGGASNTPKPDSGSAHGSDDDDRILLDSGSARGSDDDDRMLLNSGSAKGRIKK